MLSNKSYTACNYSLKLEILLPSLGKIVGYAVPYYSSIEDFLGEFSIIILNIRNW